jgi:hypothetical protein
MTQVAIISIESADISGPEFSILRPVAARQLALDYLREIAPMLIEHFFEILFTYFGGKTCRAACFSTYGHA